MVRSEGVMVTMKGCAVLVVVYCIVTCKSQKMLSNPYRGERYRTGIFASMQGKGTRKIFKTTQVSDHWGCLTSCMSHPDCQSFNYQTLGNPKHLCELSEDFLPSSVCTIEKQGYNYYYPIKKNLRSCQNACKNGGTCESTCQGEICRCQSLNKGDDCSEWTVTGISSCKDIYTKTSYRANMAYTYIIDSKPTDIYCHLANDICGGGGWTLVIKMVGSRKTEFGFNSILWSNKVSHNVTAGQTAFDNYQTKMPSYWAMPFQKLCVGMKVNNVLKWAPISYSGSSLYDVIADGKYRSFSIGRNMWLSLVSGASLQAYCNREGFNNPLYSGKCRIGIVGNNENDCGTPDTVLGLGLSYSHSCGSLHVAAQSGYIMIQ